MERDLIEQATLLNTREEYVAWEQRCDKFIESLEEQSRIKRPRLSTGNRQSVIACIAQLESLKDLVLGFVNVGAGYGLRWCEIETAFESRILTGAIINSNYIEPRRFLEDASEIALERVQCIMQRYDSLKINTVFNGEFVAGDKRANKSIITGTMNYINALIARVNKKNLKLSTTFPSMSTLSRRGLKLINNAAFGKTMENVRDRVDVKLLTKWEGRYSAEAMIAKPNFHSRSVFSENLVAIDLRKLEVKFDKPIYVGMCILDMSKTCLYEFHHEYMTSLFRKCKIIYTDTDSLIYHVECDVVYDIMKRDINRKHQKSQKFDTDYSIDNAYGIPLANKKVPGLMKDKNNGAIMTDFVGLRAKTYALRVQGKKDMKKTKDVKSSVVAKSITFEDYTRLNDAIEMTRRQSCIRSKLHEVYTITKIVLSPHDDKWYIVSGFTNTLPWGHYRCK
ncbi:hypothetical protein ALC60_08544 [Trachymyrmex zeteki]|uniref:DNA-directed DNA polymerase n=1 Tax=Mycetomoellerius zeteki TaxID=64791 RepID=A0A151WXI5_9HYME|nr:hypothetical protein ALC60_08544 [Trachymyrmex zeteki]